MPKKTDDNEILGYGYDQEPVSASNIKTMTGLEPHTRPGHRAPDEKSSRERTAVTGINALQHPPAEDWSQT
ncbi:MAG: hypothetical protein ACK42D_00580 [Candidatus Paceibacteria bacterium]